MAKEHYGQYRYPLLKIATDGDIHSFDPIRFPAFVSQQTACTASDRTNVVIVALAEWAVLNGKGEHLFITPDTATMISRATAKISDEQLIKFSISSELGVIYTPGIDPVMFIQRPGESLCITDSSGGIFRVEHNLRKGWAIESGVDLADRLRFVCGVFMLKECFPEVFTDGVPEECVKHVGWYKKKKAFGVDIGKVRSSVAPHIRSGHFRMLSSDKFKKKKGQIIFVKPAMVNAKAETADKQ